MLEVQKWVNKFDKNKRNAVVILKEQEKACVLYQLPTAQQSSVEELGIEEGDSRWILEGTAGKNMRFVNHRKNVKQEVNQWIDDTCGWSKL